MNVEDYLEQLNPGNLKKIIEFTNKLSTQKINDRLTNQDCQKSELRIKCPICKSISRKRNGHKNGTQRYLCKNCNKSFSIATSTILYHSKIKCWKLKEFIKCLLDIKPIVEISKQTKMPKTQAYYLEIKLFKALEETYNNVKLKGVVQADLKYFRII